MGSSLSPLQHSYQHPMGYLDLLQFKLGLINYGSDVLLILAPAPTLRLFWIRLRLFSHSDYSSGSDFSPGASWLLLRLRNPADHLDSFLSHFMRMFYYQYNKLIN